MNLLDSEERAELGRRGGKARLKTMTPEERSEIARRAGKASALKRWGKKTSK